MTPGERLVSEYLEALRRAVAGLPEPQRRELLEGTCARLRASVGDGCGDESEVRGVLADLGCPVHRAAAHAPATDAALARPRRAAVELALVVGSLVGMLAVLASALPPG